MESIISTLAILPTTKEQIELFASKLENELDNGVVSALDVVLIQKCFEKTFDKVKPKLSELARYEAEKYGQRFEYKGLKIELAEVGTKYDFTQCGHTDYNNLVSQIDALNEKKKAIETMIKTFKDPQNMISEEGEPMTVNPPIKSSTSSIKVTI